MFIWWSWWFIVWWRCVCWWLWRCRWWRWWIWVIVMGCSLCFIIALLLFVVAFTIILLLVFILCTVYYYVMVVYNIIASSHMGSDLHHLSLTLMFCSTSCTNTIINHSTIYLTSHRVFSFHRLTLSICIIALTLIAWHISFAFFFINYLVMLIVLFYSSSYCYYWCSYIW